MKGRWKKWRYERLAETDPLQTRPPWLEQTWADWLEPEDGNRSRLAWRQLRRTALCHEVLIRS
jgi:hypothetical protein